MSEKLIDKETVLKIYSYLNDERYSQLTHAELGLLCGVSSSTISRVKAGKYDHLLKEVEDSKDSTTLIPYDTLKHLVSCEYAINAILANCVLSKDRENVLFIPFTVVHGILKAYLPDEVNNRLQTLQREEENNE